jgi:hypothetical protein
MNDEGICKKFSLHFGVDDGLWIVWTNSPILTFGSGENAVAACADFFTALLEENEFMKESRLTDQTANELLASNELINGFTDEDLLGE